MIKKGGLTVVIMLMLALPLTTVESTGLVGLEVSPVDLEIPTDDETDHLTELVCIVLSLAQST